MKTIFVSVEGQTEYHFVRYFVEPYLKTSVIVKLKPSFLVTEGEEMAEYGLFLIW